MVAYRPTEAAKLGEGSTSSKRRKTLAPQVPSEVQNIW